MRTLSNDSPVGSIIAYAGRLSTPNVNPLKDQQDYPTVAQETGLTNNVEAFGWTVCDGKQLYVKDYPELYQALGTLYNQSSDPTDMDDKDALFRVPDYRGYFLRGASGSSENDPDQSEREYTNGSSVSGTSDDVGSIQQDALQTHEHTYSETTATATNAGDVPGSTLTTEEQVLTGEPTNNIVPASNTVKTSDEETRPKNFYVYYLIKYAYVQGFGS
jgi:microcystin-dependent protein